MENSDNVSENWNFFPSAKKDYFEQIEIVFNNSFPIINIKDDYNGNKKPKNIKKFEN